MFLENTKIYHKLIAIDHRNTKKTFLHASSNAFLTAFVSHLLTLTGLSATLFALV